MLDGKPLQQGVTFIEVVIGVAIIGILMSMGMPAFGDWLQNVQIRTAATSMLNGLQLARSESVRRNATVRFSLLDATGTTSWRIGCVTVTANCPAQIQSVSSQEGTMNARAGVSTVAPASPVPVTQYSTAISSGTGLPAGVSFNSFGRIPTANVGADVTRIDVLSVSNAAARRLVIVISPGGMVRLCDPALAIATNPQGCS